MLIVWSQKADIGAVELIEKNEALSAEGYKNIELIIWSVSNKRHWRQSVWQFGKDKSKNTEHSE